MMMNHPHPRSSSAIRLVAPVIFHVTSILSSKVMCIYAGSVSISASAAQAEQSKQTQSRYLQCAHSLCKSAASVLLCIAQLTLCLLPGQSNTLTAAISRSTFGQIATQGKAPFVGIGHLIGLSRHYTASDTKLLSCVLQ